MCYIIIGIGDGNIIWLVTAMLYGFAIIIVTIVGVLGNGLVTGILYDFDMDNGGICYGNFS